MVRIRTRRTRWATRARRSRVSGSGTHTLGKRSCLRRSSRCRASRRSVFVLRTTIARIVAASPTRTVWPRRCVKPLSVPSGLDADRHGRSERSVEALHSVALVDELLVQNFARGRVEDGDLLLSRVQITSNECHESGLLFGGVGDGPAAEPYQQRETVLMTSIGRPP